ncbi:kinase-like protein [Gloeophyllum trabeum ATCC 11539]|uniref:Kinase-like protein n=1 Tax=Gloeophyllum trabeum (strain ATCC 11539 / FP-39264 / Madison 617) TaxID=670483 RepID=S7RM47_GLOTA|nr:kinase-like protein [Gloeophyllum trabeum ATCC 11539]EPQ53784.1 kinase-like protein [Gloeophyllum trabeum ATCC 11539]
MSAISLPFGPGFCGTHNIRTFRFNIPWIVKITERTTSTEAHALRYLHSTGIDIPIPRLVFSCVHRGTTYTVMTRIPGTRMWDTKLPVDAVEAIADEVSVVLSKLQTLRQSPAEAGKVKMSASGHDLPDATHFFEARTGPYSSVLELVVHSGSYRDEEEMRSDLDPAIIEVMTADPIRYVHPDLRTYNIMVHDGHLSGIIDWEDSGWYPSSWQVHTMRFARSGCNGPWLQYWRSLQGMHSVIRLCDDLTCTACIVAVPRCNVRAPSDSDRDCESELVLPYSRSLGSSYAQLRRGILNPHDIDYGSPPRRDLADRSPLRLYRRLDRSRSLREALEDDSTPFLSAIPGNRDRERKGYCSGAHASSDHDHVAILFLDLSNRRDYPLSVSLPALRELGIIVALTLDRIARALGILNSPDAQRVQIPATVTHVYMKPHKFRHVYREISTVRNLAARDGSAGAAPTDVLDPYANWSAAVQGREGMWAHAVLLALK